MQLPAAQTSLEPLPRPGQARAGRQPFVTQNTPQGATAADSRASPPCSAPEDPRSPDSQEGSKQVADYGYPESPRERPAGVAQICQLGESCSLIEVERNSAVSSDPYGGAPREKHGGSSGWALAGRAITGRSEWSGVALLRLGAALRFAVECRRQP
jgi:hypothetical protein